MLKKRIIPCLDIKNGRTVKGVNFIDIQDAGDPIQLAKDMSSKVLMNWYFWTLRQQLKIDQP